MGTVYSMELWKETISIEGKPMGQGKRNDGDRRN